ncbi:MULTISPECIES: hypothetical protein [unclassified Streptomyces]|uniref:hypothetical protein n=1 Tax=unclassified Streptomyces TaxID=2593676 RepID=UPI0029669E3D|nr:hypothetical protein [Streptomyces sp. SJL17-1]
MSEAELRLRHMVEQTSRTVTDAEGRINRRNFVDAVRSKLGDGDLDPATQVIALDRLAEKLVTDYGDKHNPRPRGPNSLFHPDDILKLGNGNWVRMARAKDFDVVAWQRLSRRNRVHVDEADNKINDYSDARLDAFRTTPGNVDLIDLERFVFGWTEEEAGQTGLF